MTGLFGVLVQHVGTHHGQRIHKLLQARHVHKPVRVHPDGMDHVGCIFRRLDHLAMTCHDGCGTGANALDLRRDCSDPVFQQRTDGLCSPNVTAAAANAHCQILRCRDRRKISGELFRGHFIAHPARFADVAIKQKFRRAAGVGCIAELPKFLIIRLCRGRRRPVQEQRFAVVLALLQFRPPPVSVRLRISAAAYLLRNFRRSFGRFPVLP